MSARAIWIAGFVAVSTIFAVVAAAMIDTRSRLAKLEAERSLAPSRHGPVEYVSWGEAPPIVVLHGAGGGFDQGRLLAQAIGAPGVRWISVSRFGYLGSALPAAPTPVAQAEAVVDLLDALGVERFGVLAMSGGVPPALALAEHFPERIDRMMLLSPAPFTPFAPEVADRPIPTWAYSALLGNDVIYWALTKVARPTLEQAFDARADLRTHMSDDEARFVTALIDGFGPASRRVAGVANEGAAVDPEMTYALDRISAPTLIVHARDDRLNPFAVAEVLDAGILDSRLLALPAGGHLLLGHHAALRREFSDFMVSNEDQ